MHTKGPWTAHDDDGTGPLPCVLSAHVNSGGNFYVAQCNVLEDAKLIAMAPEMYELLRLISARLELQERETLDGNYMLAAFREDIATVIAKAEGEQPTGYTDQF